MRIYDKALEEGEDGHWVRVELVMRHGNARTFAEQVVTAPSVGKLAAQAINDKFSFIERDDSNITRCTVCRCWPCKLGYADTQLRTTSHISVSFVLDDYVAIPRRTQLISAADC